ncbi:hypothetical protein [Myxococcus faecalis]
MIESSGNVISQHDGRVLQASGQRHPLPEVDAATRRYEVERTDERL